jgi:methyl-accepting chemotaxis protein
MVLLRTLKLSYRLAVLIAIFSAGLVVFGLWSFNTLNELKVNGPVYRKIVQNKDLIADVLPPPEYILESYLVSFQLITTEDRAEQDKLIERFKVLKSDYDMRHDFWSKEHLDDDIADALLKQANAPALAFYAISLQQFIPAIQARDKAGATAAMIKMKLFYEQHLLAIKRLVDMATQRATATETESNAHISSASVLLLTILLLSLGAGMAGAALITKSITGPLQDAVHVAQVVASGDLRSQISRGYSDEPGQLLNALKSMNDSLHTTVGRVRRITETISIASREIAAGNFDLSSRTEAQASALEETSSAMEQLTNTVKQNAASALQANQLVSSAAVVAVQGGKVVDRVMATMASIKESSSKIVDIIAVIDGIAFQTNILALNAAVEAARAGEQGRGFAVVASEVRALAHRSASAAKEIKALIADSVGKVDAGSKLVDEAGDTMEQIVLSVGQVADIMGKIATASHEQSEGIAQVSQAISQMDEATQKNAALVEQAAAAAASMQEQAGNMMHEVSVFKLLHSDASVAQPGAPPSTAPPGALRLVAAETTATARQQQGDTFS